MKLHRRILLNALDGLLFVNFRGFRRNVKKAVLRALDNVLEKKIALEKVLFCV